MDRFKKGVEQVERLWKEKDGSKEEFEAFCKKYFVEDADKLKTLYDRLSDNFESIFGRFTLISQDIKRGMQVSTFEMLDVDEIFSAYEPQAHFSDDFFDNKLAFVVILNFPSFTLEEKENLGKNWTRLEWAYARLGDMFTDRVPAEVIQKETDANVASDNYISNYNIYVGHIVDENFKSQFPKELKLISHWGLRDELKAEYTQNELQKQESIYEIMLKVIKQEIPQIIIDNPDVVWNPKTNEVFKLNGLSVDKISAPAEPDTRYEYLLNNFLAVKGVDPYTPLFPTYIQRAFGHMEIPKEQVQKLFIEFCSSPLVKDVANLIKSRLGRDLRPFDIWYSFKSKNSVVSQDLDAITKAKYPDAKAFENDIPNILVKLGFEKAIADEIASHIAVDPVRGSGHAWGAQIKGEKARLRTAIGKDGMDYQGFNVAMHELGHCVEQTISLYMVDYYFLNGTPNTAFTEAYAFNFQKRDLEMLGLANNDTDTETMEALNSFWHSYEIMGVSLVDMNVWEWMYSHQNATKSELKEAVIQIAINIWNTYYAPIFGEYDSPILAIYSHMINNPLYLSNYPIGHLIEFQLTEHFKGKDFAEESLRIYKLGNIIPQQWMNEAVGDNISIQPLLKAAGEALKTIK